MSSRNRVIVRAYGDEPTPLWVSKVVGGRFVVTNEAESSTLSLPGQSVFKFDGVLFEQLRETFDNGNTDQLISLWDKAIPYIREKVLQ